MTFCELQLNHFEKAREILKADINETIKRNGKIQFIISTIFIGQFFYMDNTKRQLHFLIRHLNFTIQKIENEN